MDEAIPTEPASIFDDGGRRRLATAMGAIGLLMGVGLGPWMFGRTRPLVLGFPAWMWVEAVLGIAIWGVVYRATDGLLGENDGGD